MGICSGMNVCAAVSIKIRNKRKFALGSGAQATWLASQNTII